MKHILVREALCSGCRACELACVARHDGRFGTASARISIFKDELAGVDRPRVCHQCLDALCVAACPTAALARPLPTSTIQLDAGQCVCCTACTDACSFGVLSVHRQTGLPLICDLCDGEPACVERCVTGALACGDPDSGACEADGTPSGRSDKSPSRRVGPRA